MSVESATACKSSENIDEDSKLIGRSSSALGNHQKDQLLKQIDLIKQALNQKPSISDKEKKTDDSQGNNDL